MVYYRTSAKDIELPNLSYNHATLFIRDGKVWVKDEGSRYGTFVNRVRVTGDGVALGNACQLTLGSSLTIAEGMLIDDKIPWVE